MLCLRLAVIRCHARGADSADVAFGLQRSGAEARLAFGDDWAERHPRTRYLLEEEAAQWARHGPLALVLPR